MKCGFCEEDIHMPEQEGVDYHGYVTVLSPNAKMRQLYICGDCLYTKLRITLDGHAIRILERGG